MRDTVFIIPLFCFYFAVEPTGVSITPCLRWREHGSLFDVTVCTKFYRTSPISDMRGPTPCDQAFFQAALASIMELGSLALGTGFSIKPRVPDTPKRAHLLNRAYLSCPDRVIAERRPGHHIGPPPQFHMYIINLRQYRTWGKWRAIPFLCSP